MSKFDVAFVGTGFASCVLALVLQRMGLRCLLLEARQHPRFSIGESSTPIADQILLDLGTDFQLPELVRLGRWSTARHIPQVSVGCKQGFSYFFHPDSTSLPADDPVPLLLVPASATAATADSHWHRASVDHYLVKCARSRGAVIMENSKVVALHRHHHCWTITAVTDRSTQGKIAQQTTWEADFLIDGSGTARVVATLLDQQQKRPTQAPDKGFAFASNSGSLFGHFQLPVPWSEVWEQWGCDSQRFSFPPQHAALHHVTDNGWMWHLAFDNDVVSLGWVLPGAAWDTLRKDSSAEQRWIAWQSQLARYPRLQRLYAQAKLVDPPGGLGLIPQHQRFQGPIADSGWLALPHTVGFVDPLHSTGIAHALCSVQKIVRTIKEGGAWDQRFLDLYAQRMRREFWLIDHLVNLAYASRGNPEKWEAATMLYFAGAIAFEEWRSDSRRSRVPGSPPHWITELDKNYEEAPWKGPDFLLADQGTWLERVARGRGLLQRKKPPAGGWLEAMSEIIGAWNTVGLCDPACRSIYHYTVARK